MLKMRTAILCRTNAPLVKCAFDLIKLKFSVKIIGRDIAQSLKDTIGDIIETRRSVTLEEFLELADRWVADMRQKYSRDDKAAAKLADIEDRHGCLVALGENVKTLNELFKKIDECFVDADAIDDPNTIVLCSGHRSKGLEFPRVIIIRPDLMPHPKATNAEDLAQEHHLEYVILTRAEKEMYLCADDKPN